MTRVLLCLLLWCATSVAWANPSDRAPHDPFDLHGQESVPELAATAQQLAEKARGTLQKIDAAAVGKTAQQNRQLLRLANQLKLWGEPAGADYELRVQRYTTALYRVRLALLQLPSASGSVAALRTKVSQLVQQRSRQIPKLQKLLEQEKPLEAEKELNEILDELEPLLYFLEPEERAGIVRPFEEVTIQIVPAARRQRQAAAQASLAQRRDALTPDWSQFVTQINEAKASVGKTGKHAVDGKELSGPELVAHFDNRWRQLHVGAMKALALEWARLDNQDLSTSPQLQQIQASYTQATAEITAALAGLVSADADRVAADGAAPLHAAYLPPIADVCDRVAGDEMPSTLAAALAKLVTKSPDLAAKTVVYRAATDDLLRWRERVATEQALTRATGYETLVNRTSQNFVHSPDQPGLFTADKPSPAEAKLHDAAGLIMLAAAPKVVGQKATAQAITAIGSASQAGIAQFDQRIYARVKLVPEQLAPQIAQLQKLLRVTEQQPPLTLTATRALRGAQRGDVQQIGGEISSVYLEGQVTRFATLPEAAALLLPLGKLPESNTTTSDQLPQVVLRYDLQPHWWRLRYLVVDAK